MYKILKKYILLTAISAIMFFVSCSTSSFTYKAAREIDLKKIQFYLKLDGSKIPVIGGPVYHKITKTSNKEKSAETNEGIGTYKEVTTKLIQEDAIRIPLGTPGILHHKSGSKKLFIDFGEDIILEFECYSPDHSQYYTLNTRKITVNGEEYDYDAGGGGWYLSNYVLDADIDMDLVERQIKESNEKEIKGKTLKDKDK